MSNHNDQDDGSEKQVSQQFWNRINVTGFWALLVSGAVLIAVVIILAFSTNDTSVRATILAAGIPAVLTFVVVVIQAVVNRQMAEIMERQETEMTKQRQTTEKQWEAMKAQETRMIEQRDLMQRQLDMVVRNECAYFGIKNWELPHPVNNELVVTGTFFNGGRTPAWDFTRQFQVEVGSGTPPIGCRDIKWKPQTDNASPSIVIAGGETNFITDPLTLQPETVNGVITGEQIVLIDGECIYSDVTGCKWVYRFGFTLEVHTLIPKAFERYQTHEKYSGGEIPT